MSKLSNDSLLRHIHGLRQSFCIHYEVLLPDCVTYLPVLLTLEQERFSRARLIDGPHHDHAVGHPLYPGIREAMVEIR